MHSASIDVGKILCRRNRRQGLGHLSEGQSRRSSRAAPYACSADSETRAIATIIDSDGEFQRSVNRYVHDFEAMLRRVLAERDGGMMAVTLMSSDMGKLYAALAQAIDRRR